MASDWASSDYEEAGLGWTALSYDESALPSGIEAESELEVDVLDVSGIAHEYWNPVMNSDHGSNSDAWRSEDEFREVSDFDQSEDFDAIYSDGLDN